MSGRNLTRCGAVLGAAAVVPLSAEHPAILAQHELLAASVAETTSCGIYGEAPVPIDTFLLTYAPWADGCWRTPTPGDFISKGSHRRRPGAAPAPLVLAQVEVDSFPFGPFSLATRLLLAVQTL